MKVSVIGGDLRSVYLVRRLLRDGHRVQCFALELADLPGSCQCSTLDNAMAETQCVVLPIPAMDGEVLRSPYSAHRLTPQNVIDAAPPVPMLAGAPGETLNLLCTDRGLFLTDLLNIESLTMRNAAITAECAIGLIISHTPYALMGEPVLILGAGRIGRQLAQKLRGLGAEVTVAARKSKDRTWCALRDLDSTDVYALSPILPRFRLVINTIPARVLDDQLLSRLPTGARLVELASKPGGFDPAAAESLGLTVIPGGGLPGTLAPESAADAIADTIYSIIER